MEMESNGCDLILIYIIMYNIRCIILDLDLTKAFITTEIKCTGCTRLYDCAILNTLTLDQG